MSRKTRTTIGAVEKLIEQRRLFQDWLVKLDAGGEGMPPHVIDRVRNDYRARLTSVTTELAEHSDALREALSEAQDRHHHLEKQQGTKKDELAELRLRKHVGEVDEGRYRDENNALGSALESLKKDLTAALRDIERYEEILEVIAEGSREKEEEPEEEEEEEEVKKPVVAVEKARAAAPPPPPPPEPKKEERPVSRPSGETPKPQPSAEDELAFLRSVTSTVGAQKAPAPSQTPNRTPKFVPEKPPEKPVERPKPEAAAPAVTINAAPHLIDFKGDDPPVEAGARPAEKEAAGIKCAECGTMNRPTEWYCEKCGAELSNF